MTETAAGPIRVLIVDDHLFYREGIKTLLATRPDDVLVVAEASSGEEAVDLVTRLSPDVVLMDLRMPGMGGLAATRAVAGTTAVLVLTMHDDDNVVPALQAGARGYLVKDASLEDLVRAIVAVHRGQAVLAPQAAERVQRQLSRPRPVAPGFPELTEREHEVLTEIVQGHSNAQIARRLGLSDKTVRNYSASVLAKLHARDRAHLVVIARDRLT